MTTLRDLQAIVDLYADLDHLERRGYFDREPARDRTRTSRAKQRTITRKQQRRNKRQEAA